jgi:ferredoxin
MPKKYMIHTRAVPHRFKAITRSGIIAWEEGCLKCPVCVKKQCVYKVYEHRGLDTRQMMDSLDNECMNCLRCVQGCPKQLIHKGINPEFKALGDAHWTPDILARLWYQAETGRSPCPEQDIPAPSAARALTACGPTCLKSSVPQGTAFTAGSTSARPWIWAERHATSPLMRRELCWRISLLSRTSPCPFS